MKGEHYRLCPYSCNRKNLGQSADTLLHNSNMQENHYDVLLLMPCVQKKKVLKKKREKDAKHIKGERD